MSRSTRLASDRLRSDQTPQSVCHSAWIVGQAAVSTPVIGREGLLRLVGVGRAAASTRPAEAGRAGGAGAGIFSR